MKLALLVLCGMIYGAVAGWLFRRFTDTAALRLAVNRSIAHVLEFRLFIDEPRLIFRAQRDLVRANVAGLRAVAIPMVISCAILVAGYVPLENTLGRAPLDAGDLTIAKVASTAEGVDLIAPFGVAVETPALRIPSESVTIWRVRAMSPVSGEFRTVPQALHVQINQREVVYFGVSWIWVLVAAASLSAVARQTLIPSIRTDILSI